MAKKQQTAQEYLEQEIAFLTEEVEQVKAQGGNYHNVLAEIEYKQEQLKKLKEKS